MRYNEGPILDRYYLWSATREAVTILKFFTSYSEEEIAHCMYNIWPSTKAIRVDEFRTSFIDFKHRSKAAAHELDDDRSFAQVLEAGRNETEAKNTLEFAQKIMVEIEQDG